MEAILTRLAPPIADLEQFIAAAPNTALEKLARPQIDALRGSINQWQPRAAVLFYGKPDATEVDLLEKYFAACPTLLEVLTKKVKAETRLDALHASAFFWQTMTAPVEAEAVFVFVFESEKGQPHLASHLAAHSANAAAALFFGPKDWINEARKKSEWIDLAAACQFFDLKNLAEKDFKTDAERLFDQKIRASVGSFSAISALENIAAQMHERIQSLESQFKNAKIINQQRLAAHQKNGSSSFGLSQHAELKSTIAKRQERFEKQLAERIENRFEPGRGDLSAASEAQIDCLQTLDEVKQATKTVFRVPEPFTESLLSNYKKRCAELFGEDAETAFQTIKVVEKETENYLAERGITAPGFAHSLPDKARIDRMLEAQIRFDRTHEGSIANKKLMQYFMEARMYFMLVMMLGATFGFSSWMRKQKSIFLPLTILLLGFGIYSAWSKRQKEVEENNAANLKSAQDSLRSELRRVQSELARSWQKTLGDAVKEAITAIRDEAERLLAAADSKTKAQSDQEKRQIDSIEKEFRTEESWLPRALEGRWREKILLEKKTLGRELARHFVS